jgi:hypothetical protein
MDIFIAISQINRKIHEKFPEKINKTPPEQKKENKDIYFHYGKAKH